MYLEATEHIAFQLQDDFDRARARIAVAEEMLYRYVAVRVGSCGCPAQ